MANGHGLLADVVARLFTISSFGLTLGAFNHRSTVFNGTSWLIGGRWISMWRVEWRVRSTRTTKMKKPTPIFRGRLR
jgi:hypothetical protein